MSDEKRRYKAIIAGRPYTIMGKKSEEHLKIVAEIVNDTLRQLMASQPDLDIEQRSILVAVNAISENVSKQIEIEELKEQNAALEKKNEQLRRRMQTIQNQNRQSNPTNKTEKEAEAPVVEPKPTTTTKFIKPSATSTREQKENTPEVSSTFTGKNGMPAASKKKLESKAAQKNGALRNR